MEGKRVLTVSEYIDKVCEDKEVIHTYKVHDSEESKIFADNFKIRFNTHYGNMDCKKKDFDSYCEFVGDEK